ncbi:MAG: EAL domain-containing protein [Pseudomonadota bacterium]
MLDEGRFGLILAPTHAASLETAIQVASRLQKTLETPVDLGGLRLYTSLTIGFCIPTRSEARSGAAQLAAAEAALADALGAGRAAIRAYSPGKSRTRVARTGLVTEVEAALEQGHIVPWFQPQLSTDTGQVSGVEALARWRHPKHGLISPGAFLPAISAAGLSCRLSEIILYHALAAQRAWDEAGLHVPTVGVNFSSEDLNDPHLFDKVQWELDRFQLTPDRLAVEILETVISQSENDVITRNITRLGEFGCHIDLDDFGTGHSSLANVRRFRVNRIKIDRSFVTQIDSDRQQQQMLAAILELANRLRIETLAEGVESSGEHTMLAQLGCAHVQGYHIAKPLPFDDATSWLKRQAKTQTSFPGLPKQSGT